MGGKDGESHCAYYQLDAETMWINTFFFVQIDMFLLVVETGRTSSQFIACRNEGRLLTLSNLKATTTRTRE